MSLTGISRFAIKGLSSDRLRQAELRQRAGLINDRRFAFVFRRSAHLLEENKWLHKENFVSVFATPKVALKFTTSFDDRSGVLTIRRRAGDATPVLQACLETADGRDLVSKFLSEEVGEPVVCIDGAETHQFGNTSKGLAASGDLRTLHIVNANTVRDLSRAAGVPLDPRRFRPNLIVDELPAWAEFAWVGQTIRVGKHAELAVIARTVRCPGVDQSSELSESNSGGDAGGEVGVAALLARHFPEHGPYLGVYAQCTRDGHIEVGDGVELRPVHVWSWLATPKARAGIRALGAIAFHVLLVMAAVHLWKQRGGR